MATAGGWAESLLGTGRLPKAPPAFIAMAPNSKILAANGEGGGKMSPALAIGGYLVAILVIVLVILLFVHFTIRPIFQFVPGGSGFIPIPGLSDGQVYWRDGKDVAPMDEDRMIAKYPTQNYSFTLDIFVRDPTTVLAQSYQTPQPNTIFSRGTPATQGLAEENTVKVLLLPGTNDLQVIVRNASHHDQGITLPNVPVQTPFRLGVVIMDMAFEVYVNGRLMKSRTLDAAPLTTVGRITPPQGTFANMVKVGNLHMWSRTLTPSEIRYAQPSLMGSSLFSNDPLTGTLSSCLSDLEKDVEANVPAQLTSTMKNLSQTMQTATKL